MEPSTPKNLPNQVEENNLDNGTYKNGNGHSYVQTHAQAGPSKKGFTWERLFGNRHPYEDIIWETRTAKIVKGDGTVVFEQNNVEVPNFWSQTATDIVASKYFRGRLDSSEREYSAKQMVDRIAKTIGYWGFKDSYFASLGDATNFVHDLTHLLISQYAAFNSPVWFNVGVHPRPQVSACFILHVEDNMQSILDWYRDEGWIFKYGSGAGLNLSNLRSSKEPLSHGGFSSGPISFMKGADGVANSIRSGGTTRRAAKMIVLNVDHPDIKTFIYCKKIIEDMTKILQQAGIKDSVEADLFDPYTLLPYQNANNSVRVTNDFMRAVEADGSWDLKARTTGKTIETVKAKEVMSWIADAAWQSADPGMQYDTTINEWHTLSNTSRINASNPCFTGDTLIYTDKGLIRFDELYSRFNAGEKIRIYTHNITNKTVPENSIAASLPAHVMTTGINDIYKLVFSSGLEIKVTENHKFWTENRGWVQVKDLEENDRVKILDSEILFPLSDLNINSDFEKIYESRWGKRNTKHFKKINLPGVWTNPFAEYVGYMVGDGCLVETDRLSTASVVFGTKEEADEILPRFESIIEEMGVQPYVVAMSNGTVQMRVIRIPFVRFLKELGVKSERAHLKRVPHTIFQTPKHIIAGFLRGLFSADGCVYEGINATRYVGLGSVSEKLLKDVQQLLLSFGIVSKIYKTRKPRKAFSYIKKTGELKEYYGKQLYDLRITAKSLVKFKEKIGFMLTDKQEKLSRIVQKQEFYNVDESISLISREYAGQELTYNLTESINHSYLANGIIVANCSEYMSIDNSSCNLASLNLLKFLQSDGKFNVDFFRKAVDTMIVAMDIIIDNASFPTEKIEKNTKDYRQLGLGYANLGALLMVMGLPYDSENGRALAGQITSLICGEAYRMSALIADIKGPFNGYELNKEPMLGVIRKHLGETEKLKPFMDGFDFDNMELYNSARSVWYEALELGQKYGIRNSQATVLAPTGTIAFLMDCDTTGIEPELALIKYKKLVGGGTLKLINHKVPQALKKLGYNEEQIEAISKHLLDKETIEGAPHLRDEHLPVFDCSFKASNGTRSIHYMGHVQMMAAAQPFISGAISKTVNLPTEATVEDIKNVFIEGWRLGLKSIAVYRDGSKSIQPLNTKKDDKNSPSTGSGQLNSSANLIEKVNGYTRIKLPDERPSITHKFSVGGYESYLTVGLYPDTNKPGETFITTAKEGSTVAGLFDTIATLVSMCLQSGMPLKSLVRKFKDMRFEPSGFTNNPQIPMAKSVMDYVFRYIGMKYLNPEDREEIFGPDLLHQNKTEANHSLTELIGENQPKKETILAVATPDNIQQEVNYQADAPICANCGTLMFKAGSCYSCPNCFATTGVCN